MRARLRRAQRGARRPHLAGRRGGRQSALRLRPAAGRGVADDDRLGLAGRPARGGPAGAPRHASLGGRADAAGGGECGARPAGRRATWRVVWSWSRPAPDLPQLSPKNRPSKPFGFSGGFAVPGPGDRFVRLANRLRGEVGDRERAAPAQVLGSERVESVAHLVERVQRARRRRARCRPSTPFPPAAARPAPPAAAPAGCVQLGSRTAAGRRPAIRGAAARRRDAARASLPGRRGRCRRQGTAARSSAPPAGREPRDRSPPARRRPLPG